MSKLITGKIIFCFLAWMVVISVGSSLASAREKPIIDQAQVNKAIGLQIEKNMPWPAGTMRFEIYTRLPEISMPTGKVTWKVDIKNNYGYLGDVYFVLKIYNDGVVFREETIRAKIEVMRDYVVSNKSLNRNEVISEQDVVLRKKWMRSIPANLISNLDDVVGKALLTSIRPNTEIASNMLREVAAVKRGKMVQIVLDAGAIKITTMGMSEEDGVTGSFVRVKNISSNKILYARVIGESKVRVDFQ